MGVDEARALRSQLRPSFRLLGELLPPGLPEAQAELQPLQLHAKKVLVPLQLGHGRLREQPAVLAQPFQEVVLESDQLGVDARPVLGVIAIGAFRVLPGEPALSVGLLLRQPALLAGQLFRLVAQLVGWWFHSRDLSAYINRKFSARSTVPVANPPRAPANGYHSSPCPARAPGSGGALR